MLVTPRTLNNYDCKCQKKGRGGGTPSGQNDYFHPFLLLVCILCMCMIVSKRVYKQWGECSVIKCEYKVSQYGHFTLTK